MLRWHYRGHGRSGVPADRDRASACSTPATTSTRVMDAAGLEQRGASSATRWACRSRSSSTAATPTGCRGWCWSAARYGTPLDTFHDSHLLKRAFPFMRKLVERFPSRAAPAHPLPAEHRAGAAVRPHASSSTASCSTRDDLEPYFEHLAKMDPVVFVRTLDSLATHSAWDHLPHVDVPTLVVGGREGQVHPRLALPADGRAHPRRRVHDGARGQPHRPAGAAGAGRAPGRALPARAPASGRLLALRPACATRAVKRRRASLTSRVRTGPGAELRGRRKRTSRRPQDVERAETPERPLPAPGAPLIAVGPRHISARLLRSGGFIVTAERQSCPLDASSTRQPNDRCERTSATSPSSPTSTTARPPSSTTCSARRASSAANEALTERVMDSNDLEREKGITILAKNTAVTVPGPPDQHHRHPGPRRLRRRGRARPAPGRRRAPAGGRRRGPPAPDALRAQQGAGAWA